MRRREFIRLVGIAAVVWPKATGAQPPQIRRVGILTDLAEDDPIAQAEISVFRAALAALGWTEGTNLSIDIRWANADPERYKIRAKELVALNPEAILSRGTSVTKALANATQTIPIVFVVVADPIGAGIATNLAHPGGNITGFSNLFTEMGGKWIEILKEIAPHTEQVSLLYNPATLAPLQLFMPSIQGAASSFAVQVTAAPVHAKEEIEGVIAALARRQGSALIVMPDGFNLANRELIIALAARHVVPTIYFNSAFFAKRGGLISYGPDFADYFRRAAGYVERILKGEKPGDLPIQQPTKFDLVVNLKTAKALGISVPPTLLARADEVIE
jgi:putative tryptophan/tyrosine transport system substrate-binding protein